MRSSCSPPSGRRTTASAPCCRSARIPAGAGSSSTRLPPDGGHVLDVATGTGLVAQALLDRGFTVTALDQSPEMLDVARARLADRATIVARARRGASLRDRLVRPPHGHVPAALRRRPGRDDARAGTCRAPGRDAGDARVRRPARALVPALAPVRRCRAAARRPPVSRGWYDVGRFLGGSIVRFWRELPEQQLLDVWREAGIDAPRLQRLSVGGGVVVWGVQGRIGHVEPDRARPAFYALEPGGWRDYWSLLHPPYTAWHLSFVVVGGCLAPVVSWSRLGLTVLAFALAMGVGAHALDELNGRPLRTRIPARVLVALARPVGRRSLRDRDRGGDRLQPLDPGRSSRSAPCSCRRTTSSCSAAACTRICGLRSHGARSRPSRGTWRARGRSVPRRRWRPAGRRSCRSRSGGSRPRCGVHGEPSPASAGRSPSTTARRSRSRARR